MTGSHEIKRCLLLGRTDMTKLDSMLKNRDIYLPKETKDLYIENYKSLMKEIKEDTNREIYRVHGLEESILSKWLYYPKQSIDLMQSLSSYQQYLSQN